MVGLQADRETADSATHYSCGWCSGCVAGVRSDLHYAATNGGHGCDPEDSLNAALAKRYRVPY